MAKCIVRVLYERTVDGSLIEVMQKIDEVEFNNELDRKSVEVVEVKND